MPSSLIPVIAIPARDEERRLPDLIGALGRQTWLGAPGRILNVTVVVNNSVDASMKSAASAAQGQPALAVRLTEIEFPTGEDHVGSARRLAMEQALAVTCDHERVILMTTDADAVPAPDWVESNLRAIAVGADLVGGLVIGNAREEAALGPSFLRRARLQAHYSSLADRLASVIDPIDHDPWPRHRDHTGASLAVRASVYRDVGGLPALPFREDLGLVRRVRLNGLRVRHDPTVRVGVSARLKGRAPGGMAETIRSWVEAAELGHPLLVEAPQAIEARLLRRSVLRRLPSADAQLRDQAARTLGIDPTALQAALSASSNGVALVERLAPDEPDAPATTPVEQALAELAGMIRDREGRYAA